MKVEMNHRAAVRGHDEWFEGLKVEYPTDTQLIILPTSFLYGEKPQNFNCGVFFLTLSLKVSMFRDVFTHFYDSSTLWDLLK